jgi:hypothetical protein
MWKKHFYVRQLFPAYHFHSVCTKVQHNFYFLWPAECTRVALIPRSAARRSVHDTGTARQKPGGRWYNF